MYQGDESLQAWERPSLSEISHCKVAFIIFIQHYSLRLVHFDQNPLRIANKKFNHDNEVVPR